MRIILILILHIICFEGVEYIDEGIMAILIAKAEILLNFAEEIFIILFEVV